MLMNPERASKLTWSGSAFRMMMMTMMIIRRSRVAQNFMKIWFNHAVFLACLIDLNFFSQNFMKNWFNGGVSCLIASKLFSRNFIKDWFNDGHVILAWLIINFLAELHEHSDSMMKLLAFFQFSRSHLPCHVDMVGSRSSSHSSTLEHLMLWVTPWQKEFSHVAIIITWQQQHFQVTLYLCCNTEGDTHCPSPPSSRSGLEHKVWKQHPRCTRNESKNITELQIYPKLLHHLSAWSLELKRGSKKYIFIPCRLQPQQEQQLIVVSCFYSRKLATKFCKNLWAWQITWRKNFARKIMQSWRNPEACLEEFPCHFPCFFPLLQQNQEDFAAASKRHPILYRDPCTFFKSKCKVQDLQDCSDHQGSGSAGRCQ